MWYDREYDARHITKIGVRPVRELLEAPPVGDIQQPNYTADLHWVREVIIEIWINLLPVLGLFRRQIGIEPGRGQ